MAVCCWCGAGLGRWDLGLPGNGPWVCLSAPCRQRQLQFAVIAHVGKGKSVTPRPLYVPTPRQVDWHEAVYHRPTTRLLVGGHAGPGKSRWLRETLYRLAAQVPGFHALLLRRTHKDLDQSHLRFVPYEVSQRGGVWKVSERVVEFPHKDQPAAVIRMGHLEDSGALQNYLSAEYDVIAPDELVTFDRDEMLELFSRARSTNPHLFALRGLDGAVRLDGSLVLTATNPGGKGARWVKDFFIDKDPGEDFKHYRPDRWAFHAAKLEDNPYIEAGYRETLEDLPEIRRRQLLEGDWDAYSGQFFSEWREKKDGQPWHVRRLDPPRDAEWFGSMDWGYNSPGVMLWWACLPDGHLHIARELKFQYEPVERVAQQIQRITRDDLGVALRYVACDPAMAAKTGAGKGESIMETLQRYGLRMRRSDNDRKNGWQRCHDLFREAPDGTPWLTVDEKCKYGRRTIPAMLQDEHEPDDLDTKGDDHFVDAKRYGAMSRPAPWRGQPKKEEAYPVGSWGFWRQYHEGQERQTGVLA